MHRIRRQIKKQQQRSMRMCMLVCVCVCAEEKKRKSKAKGIFMWSVRVNWRTSKTKRKLEQHRIANGY